jgi:hypothetical protein
MASVFGGTGLRMSAGTVWIVLHFIRPVWRSPSRIYINRYLLFKCISPCFSSSIFLRGKPPLEATSIDHTSFSFHLGAAQAGGCPRIVIWLCCSLQVCVGVILLVVGGLDINRQGDQRLALILNDVTLIMVFIISLINVVVSGFGMEHSGTRLREVSQNPPPKWLTS